MAESFRERLDAVNRELSDILSHNEAVKDRLADERISAAAGGHSGAAAAYARGMAPHPAGLGGYSADGGGGASHSYASMVADKIRGGGPHVTAAAAPSPAGGAAAAGRSYHTTSSSVLEATFAEAAAGGNTAAASPPLMTTSRDLLRLEVREAVAAEMRQQHAALHAIVAREWELRMREVDATLRGRFGELRGANEALQRVVSELADEVAHVSETLSARVDKAEADLGRKIAQLRREHDEALRRVRSEAVELSETIVAAKLDANATEGRYGELSKKLHANVADALREFDGKWNTVEDSIEATLRGERKQHALFTDYVEKALREHSDGLAGDAARIAALQQEVGAMAEEGVGQRSQLRTTRAELNQLEMLVRSIGVRQQQQRAAATASGAGGPPLHLDPLSLAPTAAPGGPSAPLANQQQRGGGGVDWQAAAMPYSEGARLQQDVYALKQSVAYLADVVERRLLSGAATNSSGSGSGHRAAGNSYSPTRYRVPESDEESNANLARSSID